MALAVLAALAAGTCLGIVVVEAARTGGLAALRADRPRALPLATVAALAATAGWWEWLRHRGAPWGLFARGLGGAAASLGAVCLGGLLGDWLLELLR
ncbi:MAG: hypothetical protein QOD77_1475 [Thermoplasmata archaeon]|nr:hypothetical protein [Thermoplasmata archaeon]